MRASQVLRQAASAQHRTPLIKFLGKRTTPTSVDHAPHVHPASPAESLPDSFATYRSKAQQHGPLSRNSSSVVAGAIGGHTGGSLGPIDPPQGQYFDRSELPARFGRTSWTQTEIDAIESGGASLFA
ncbi:MAG: Trimeric GatFAB AmidoTransferase(AdT) complex subunit [Chaenotheca gracillima]|nr:MAG: Trimeric GatFAB AmidoTransferase(AdT) complex subunit [Chaenotheca gracillima]